jgi:DNA-binding NarL/FixJ family response regulator
MSISIAIVDDKAQLRQSIADKLLQSGDVSLLFTAENGQDFLKKMENLRDFSKPQVVLMDIEMPVKNGIEAVREATLQYSNTQFLMLTVFEDEDNIFEALKAGAVGYLLKDEKIEVILNAIKDIVELGAAPMSPRVARKTLHMLTNTQTNKATKPNEATLDSILSNRELEILKHLVEGLDYREIGQVIFISPNTVRTHITNIYKKLHVTSRAQAVTIAVKKNWF